MKSVKRCMSALLIGPPRPSSPSKATMKRLKSASSSNALPPGLFAPERSPRQCIGPWFAMPRRLCVVIGPLRGLNVEPPPTRNGLLFASGTSSGLPRSHARLSKSAKTWQAAHAASPLLEVSCASYEDGTPVAHARRLGAVDRQVRGLEPRRRVDHRDRVVEARHHVEAAVRLVEHEPRRTTPADGDVIRGV